MFKKNFFENKIIAISGGGTGIGFSIASLFFNLDANVIIFGRRKEVLKKAIVEIKNEARNGDGNISYLSCDMSRIQDVLKVFNQIQKKYGRLDVLVNNCSTWNLSPIKDLEDNDIDSHFKNIFKSTILATQTASKILSNPSSIVNIGSFSGIMPMKYGSIYSSLKSAVIGFTKSSAKEFGSDGIRVNCVIPGVIRTPMTTDYIDKNYEKIIKPIALKKIGTTRDVANGVLFLSSELAQYVTGTTLEITGGKYITQD